MSITQLQRNIDEAKLKIESYKALIGSISGIKGQLDLCVSTLNQTSDLVGQAIIIDGKSVDSGKTAEIASSVSSCAGDFGSASGLASAEITKLNGDITGWQNEINRLKRIEREKEREKAAKEVKKI